MIQSSLSLFTLLVTIITSVNAQARIIPGQSSQRYPNDLNIINGQLADRKGQTRIVGGTSARPHSLPWMVQLAIPAKPGFVFNCGASIIDQQHILTAAHCICGENQCNSDTIQRAYGTTVTLGAHDVKAAQRGTDKEAVIIRGVAKVIVHEQYDSRRMRNDIALLKLRSPIKYTDAIRPIALPSASDGPKLSRLVTKALAAGWGDLSEGGYSAQILQELVISMEPIVTCKQKWVGLGLSIDASVHLCTSVKDRTDTCQGDSGGPLAVYNNNCKCFVQAGIVSFGIGCASNTPGVYANVATYIPWINRNRMM